MGTLTAALLGEERNAEAEAVCREMLEAAEGVLPPGNDTRLDLLNDLGLALRRQNKLEEAETVLRKAVDESARLRGETHPDTLASMTNLANVLSAATKFSEAEAVGRKTLEIKTRVLGPAHAETVVAQSSLATILCRQKKPEGEQVFRSLLAVVAQPAFQSRYPLAYYHDRLGWCLGELGRYPEAEKLLLGSYEDLGGTLGPKHVYTQLTVAHLVRLYQNWKRPVQAAAWQAKVASDPNH
jgi:tetratricopeptide (TPR) repeat protein